MKYGRRCQAWTPCVAEARGRTVWGGLSSLPTQSRREGAAKDDVGAAHEPPFIRCVAEARGRRWKEMRRQSDKVVRGKRGQLAFLACCVPSKDREPQER